MPVRNGSERGEKMNSKTLFYKWIKLSGLIGIELSLTRDDFNCYRAFLPLVDIHFGYPSRWRKFSVMIFAFQYTFTFEVLNDQYEKLGE